MKHENFTRGEGLLENFLAYRRFCVADQLIDPKHRQGRILDIGCGALPYFLLHTTFQEKHGLDPNVRVSDTKKFDEKITFHKIMIEKGTRLPFADQYFTTITMLGVVEHFRVEQYVDLLKEVHRILKPQGHFILTTPSPWTRPLLKIMAQCRLISVQEIEGLMANYPRETLRQCFNKSGFDDQTMRFGYFQMFLNSWAIIKK
ncbi:MAG: class I SAM-dependent methyltransferase [Candidatus Omnitrophica bacterium]|nr:class I SAM-dependent methyltransferase [Candidatus Omnitrophota bacterium]